MDKRKTGIIAVSLGLAFILCAITLGGLVGMGGFAPAIESQSDDGGQDMSTSVYADPGVLPFRTNTPSVYADPQILPWRVLSPS